MAPVLDEQSRRRFAALEAKSLGRGGVSLMARISGLARRTIYRGLHDIRNNHSTEPGRVRKRGAGRKRKTLEDPSLLPDLKRLVEPTTRGDPTQPLLWTCRSLRNLAKALADKGHKVSPTLVGNLLREIGTVCKLTARRRKELSTSIEIPNFAISMSKPKHSCGLDNLSFLLTRKRRN
jgi:Rhodopirellula transposase DDE domain